MLLRTISRTNPTLTFRNGFRTVGVSVHLLCSQRLLYSSFKPPGLPNCCSLSSMDYRLVQDRPFCVGTSYVQRPSVKTVLDE